MSLKKRLSDRVEAVDVVLKKEVEPTHTETLMFRPHPAATKTRNERKRERRARKTER